MRIIICGSISAASEIVAVREQLEALGHEVQVPEGVTNEYLRGRTEIATSEKASDKIENDLIRRYYEKIRASDAVLIVNPAKRGVDGYVGGNTFLEMGFAHVLDKPLYVLNPLPDLPYASEMIAMRPVVLNGDVSLIR